MSQRLDPVLLKKLAAKLEKPEKYIREQISRKASGAHVNSAAYLVFWANQNNIGTSRHLAVLAPYIQEQARSLVAAPVIAGRVRTAFSQRKSRKVFNGRLRRRNYVDLQRLSELQSLHAEKFDLRRLIKMCGELNHCFMRGDFIATIALVRSILNHTPPIFKNSDFAEVCKNNLIARSNRESLGFLNSHSRKIADAYLHIAIRDSETIPTATQVDFSQSLDVLLGEVIRILKIDI